MPAPEGASRDVSHVWRVPLLPRGRNFCVCSSMVMPEEKGGGWCGWNHFKDLGMGSWAAVHGAVCSWWIGKRYSKTWATYLYLNWSIWTADIYVNSNFHELKEVKWRSVSLIIIICNLTCSGYDLCPFCISYAFF